MSVLRDIVMAKRERVRVWLRERPWALLESAEGYRDPRRSLRAALTRGEGAIRFLTEIKRASPSAGPIALEADAPAVARRYQEAGSAGISLVTEEQFFRGRPDDLPLVRAVGLPVLMKDFFIDPYQVAQARALGADALLLIAAIDDRPLLRELRSAARDLGLEVLLEVHDEAECEVAHDLDPELVGVNNRDLSSFVVDLATSEQLSPRLPRGPARLAESGIRSRADVLRLEAAGFDGLLVGEHLMRASDPGRALLELRGASPRAGEAR